MYDGLSQPPSVTLAGAETTRMISHWTDIFVRAEMQQLDLDMGGDGVLPPTPQISLPEPSNTTTRPQLPT